jgi:hypothetical protein
VSPLPSAQDHQHLHLPPGFRFPMYVCLLTQHSVSEVPFHRMNCGRVIVNDESIGLACCMCAGYPKGPKNLLLTLVRTESVASLLRTRRRNFRSLADFVFIISSLYSGVHRPNLSFMYFSRFILEACSCLNIVSAKLLSFSGLWLSD